MQRYFAVAALVSVLALPAAAQTPTFASVDRDRNGQLTDNEFLGVVSDAGLYGEWDADNDGFIEENEFGAIGFGDGFGDFDTWDTDDNGYLDADEVYDGVYEGFDVDENGHWDAAEWDDAGEAGWFDV